MRTLHADRLHAEYYLRVLQAASGEYQAGGDAVLAALSRIDRELGQLLVGQARLARHAEQVAELHPRVEAYADAGREVLRLRAPQPAVEWARAALRSARARSDPASEVRYLSQLSNALRVVDDYAGAIECGEAARRLAAELGDADAEAEASGFLGVAYGQLGRFAEARPLFEAALAGASRRGDRRWVAYWLDRLGSARARLGETEGALELHEEALRILREIGDPGEASVLSNVSDVYRALGRLDEAEANLRALLELAERRGDRRAQWTRLDRLAKVVASRGDLRGALELRREAMAITVKEGDLRGEATELHNLGPLYRDLGRADEARRVLSKAIVLFDALGLDHYSGVSRRVLDALPADTPSAAPPLPVHPA